MTMTAISFCIMGVCGAVVFCCIVIIKKLREDNKLLEAEVAKYAKNVKFLLSYQEQFKELNAENKKAWEQIINATDDDEIKTVLGGIITGNNDRVPKH